MTSFRDLMLRKKGAMLFAPGGLQFCRVQGGEGQDMLFNYHYS